MEFISESDLKNTSEIRWLTNHIFTLWNDASRNEATKRGERPRKSENGCSSTLFFRFSFHLPSLVVLLCHCFPSWSRRVKRWFRYQNSRGMQLAVWKRRKQLQTTKTCFKKIAPWFVCVLFSMLYLGYLKHALAHTYFYLCVVILVKHGALDYICHPSW